MTRLTTLADAEAVAVRAVREIVRHVDDARARRSVAHLALSGGTTPARTYELLAGELSDWDGIEVWFADERCVAPEDEQSNYRLAKETLLGPIGIPSEQVHRMEGELGPKEGARRYAEALQAHVARDEQPSVEPPAAASSHGVPCAGERPIEPGLPVLDLIVLGIGPDGHVASLFPGAPTLQAGPQAICLGVHDSPKPPPERITLSLGVLRTARACLLLASGAGKADAVAAMLGEPSPHVPASLLRRERLTVLVDDQAAPPASLR
ncbi:MAG TPA: 6-phosphogluconolactonase [Solirubrobacteraceae bacterium]|jgi:6-phosphogluconolactonase